MKSISLIAWKEFSDRLRSGWVIACAAVWLGAIALTSLFGLVQIGKIGLQGYERTVMSLLNVVQYLVPLLGLLLGHDLLVSEREEKTLSLVFASGVSRLRVLLGKFLGGCFTLTFPLVLGFTIAGVVIGLSAGRTGLESFFKLALSGLALGIVFLAVGLLISILCRTRVQALVVALLTWCVAVFVFDLVALGLVVSMAQNKAAQQIEHTTDAMHVTSVADMHDAFEKGTDAAPRASEKATKAISLSLLANPVDVFRTVNLPNGTEFGVPVFAVALSLLFWVSLSLGAGFWKLRRLDL